MNSRDVSAAVVFWSAAVHRDARQPRSVLKLWKLDRSLTGQTPLSRSGLLSAKDIGLHIYQGARSRFSRRCRFSLQPAAQRGWAKTIAR